MCGIFVANRVALFPELLKHSIDIEGVSFRVNAPEPSAANISQARRKPIYMGGCWICGNVRLCKGSWFT